jgi:hypothetical protein
VYTSYAQIDTNKKVYFKTLPRLEVKNEQIYQLLDSLILYNKECIYTIHNKPYYFEINLYNESDGISIIVSSYQRYYFMKWVHDKVGCFYYKNILVIVCSSDILELFFEKEKDMIDIYYFKDYMPYSRYDGLGNECMYIEYKYINNQFIPKHKFLCEKSTPYYHKIKKDETWEKITENYGITIEELIALNKRIKIKKPPKKGALIRVY